MPIRRNIKNALSALVKGKRKDGRNGEPPQELDEKWLEQVLNEQVYVSPDMADFLAKEYQRLHVTSAAADMDKAFASASSSSRSSFTCEEDSQDSSNLCSAEEMTTFLKAISRKPPEIPHDDTPMPTERETADLLELLSLTSGSTTSTFSISISSPSMPAGNVLQQTEPAASALSLGPSGSSKELNSNPAAEDGAEAPAAEAVDRDNANAEEEAALSVKDSEEEAALSVKDSEEEEGVFSGKASTETEETSGAVTAEETAYEEDGVSSAKESTDTADEEDSASILEQTAPALIKEEDSLASISIGSSGRWEVEVKVSRTVTAEETEVVQEASLEASTPLDSPAMADIANKEEETSPANHEGPDSITVAGSGNALQAVNTEAQQGEADASTGAADVADFLNSTPSSSSSAEATLTTNSSSRFKNPSSASTAGATLNAHAFAFSLYHQLAKQQGNLFFSPPSIQGALALFHSGARGETESELHSLLGFDGHADEESDVRSGLVGGLSLWAKEGLELSPSVLELAASKFGASVSSLSSNTEASQRAINGWVAQKLAADVNEKSLSGKFLDENTKILAVTAAGINGTWDFPFSKYKNMESDFTERTGRRSKAEFMSHKEHFRYTEDDQMQVIEMNLGNGRMAMRIYLPRTFDGLDVVEASLSAARCDELGRALHEEFVRVFLPKISVQMEITSLKDSLKGLGVESAFTTSEADLSGMLLSQNSDAELTNVLHVASFSTNEEGVGSVVEEGKELRPRGRLIQKAPKQFWAQHPFVFHVLDKEEGTLLFMGRVVQL